MSVFEPRPITRPTTPTPAFVIGHVDFEWTGDARSPGPLTISPHPRVLHAALVTAPGPTTSRFQDYARSGGAWRALCGAEVLVITPAFFDDVARWTCRGCATIVNRWLDDVGQVQWELRIPLER